MFVRRLVLLLLMPMLGLTLSGCLGGSSPASHFFLLEPIAGGENRTPQTEVPMTIGLRPVKVPKYIDRPQIVSATAPNAYQLSEFNRWAENLDDNITRVVMRNLTQLVPANVWLTTSSSQAKRAPMQLAVDILEFHVNPQGEAQVAAQWRLSKGVDETLSRQMSCRSPASNTDYGLMVSALNDCLNRLSRDVAMSIQSFDMDNN